MLQTAVRLERSIPTHRFESVYQLNSGPLGASDATFRT
jgi:hypothetical protein